MGSLAREILAMLSVQSPGGLVFGTARRMEGMSLRFELDAILAAGDMVEWRMELPGLEETAMGTLRITGGQRDAAVGVAVWTGLILSLAPEDAEVFEVWRQGVERGSRAFAQSTKPSTDTWLAATTMVGSTEAERRLAVATQEERRKGRLERAKTLSSNAKKWPEPEDRTGGQAVAMGSFRASLSGSTPRSFAPAPPAERPPAPPPVVLPPGPASAAPTPVVPVPQVFVDREMVSVNFADVAAWRAARGRVLQGTLEVPAAKGPEVGTTAQVWLRLPSGITLMISAEVGAAPAGQLAQNTWVRITLPAPSSR